MQNSTWSLGVAFNGRNRWMKDTFSLARGFVNQDGIASQTMMTSKKT